MLVRCYEYIITTPYVIGLILHYNLQGYRSLLCNYKLKIERKNIILNLSENVAGRMSILYIAIAKLVIL
jgi:hypothetical protein